ncbi:MAG: hypothetical protein GTO63_28905 [Anaerolineae bacterium]|nr:hypothetical protein [Anaerolineae bacterium]NIQ81675.1 hypothetical protein [Anaerolineae bacterium]
MRVRVAIKEPGRKYQYAEVHIQLPKRLEGYEVSSTHGGAIVAEIKNGELGVLLRKKRHVRRKHKP